MLAACAGLGGILVLKLRYEWVLPFSLAVTVAIPVQWLPHVPANGYLNFGLLFSILLASRFIFSPPPWNAPTLHPLLTIWAIGIASLCVVSQNRLKSLAWGLNVLLQIGVMLWATYLHPNRSIIATRTANIWIGCASVLSLMPSENATSLSGTQYSIRSITMALSR